MLPERVGAVIIQDNRILLVTGYEELFYWTPGGKIENGETHQVCLGRELESELGGRLTSLKYYTSYKLINEAEQKTQMNYYYFVEFNGVLVPQEEITKTFWYSQQNFLNRCPKISKGLEEELIPRLIQDRILS